MGDDATHSVAGRGPLDLLVELEFRRGSLGKGLRDSLRQAIQDGRLPAYARLPSSRCLAEDLGVSRGVVSDAYDQLVSEGYLQVQPRSAPIVAPVAAVELPAPEAEAADWRYDFISTTPEVGLFPRHAWVRAVQKVLRATPDAALSYGDRRGRLELRVALSAYLARARGVRADPNRMIISQGFTQGLNLLARTLASRGTAAIAFESPSLPEFWGTVRDTGLAVVGCPVDDGGIVPEALASLDAGAAVVTPAHQFPMGAVLPPERRQALIDWAKRTAGFLVEDDYDAEFRYDRTPVGAMQGLDPAHVVHAGTVSKSLAPGLRIGWLSLPPDLIDEVGGHKEAADLGSPTIDQLALAELIANGEYERHVARIRHTYRRRRDALVRAVAARRPDLEIRGIAAGTSALLRLPDGVDDAAIVRGAATRGMRLQALSPMHLVPSAVRGLVLGYGRLPDHHVEAAVDELVEVLSASSHD